MEKMTVESTVGKGGHGICVLVASRLKASQGASCLPTAISPNRSLHKRGTPGAWGVSF